MTKERPILFNTEMVQAILRGDKTQTRRVINIKNDWNIGTKSNGSLWPYYEPYVYAEDNVPVNCPYGKPEDELWVRETFNWFQCPYSHDHCNHSGWMYRADGDFDDEVKWKPSIHMPRTASRIQLKIKRVWIERLQDISEEDAKAEGIEFQTVHGKPEYRSYLNPEKLFIFYDPINSFHSLWCSINGPESWEENPWVWCVEFEKIYNQPKGH